MMILRLRRFAISLARSMLKPWYPPDRLGNACGAKVASTPVCSGGRSCARAEATTSSATVATSKCRVMSVPQSPGVGCDYIKRIGGDKHGACAPSPPKKGEREKKEEPLRR